VTHLETAIASPPLAPFASMSAITAPPGAHPSPAPNHGVGATPATWRSLRGLTTALTVLLVVSGVIALGAMAAFANRLAAVDSLDAGDGRGLIDRAARADDVVLAAVLIYGLVTLAIGVLFIVWTWRAAKNNEALGRDMPRLGAPWAIAGWLIPLANFVIPVLVVQDLWRGSNASIPRGDMRWRIADRSALVGWWWAMWVLSVGRIVPGGDASGTGAELDAVRRSDTFSIVGMGFGLAAAVLAILVLRALVARQREALGAQQAAWAGAHAAARS
jgi:hypothetical protein